MLKRVRSLRLLPLLFLLTLLTGLPPAGAAGPRELLVVGTSFPRIYEQEEAGPSGLGVELLRRALGSRGQGLRFEFYPWVRAQAMVESGQADILMGPYRTPERELRFLFSPQAFYEDALVFYTRRERESPWRGELAELTGQRIGLVQGWAYGEALERERARLKPGTVRDVATGLQMLRLDRLDLLASNERNTEPVLRQLGMTGELRVLSPPLGQLRGHFAFPRTAEGQALRETLDRAMSEMRTRGELRELARRWNVRIPD